MKHHLPAQDAARMVAESVRGLHRMIQNIDLFSRKALRDFGVSGPQIWALRIIRDAEFITMSDLALRLHLHPSTVSGIVDRLEDRGLAMRSQASADGRVTELRLTSAGRKLVSRVPEPPRSRVARGIERLSAEDLACVHKALGILGRIMDVPEPEEAEDEGSK